MERAGSDYLAVMSYEPDARPFFVELFGPLVGLEDEWRDQGATEEEIALTAFGFDTVRRHNVEVSCGMIGGSAPKTLEETDEYRISMDGYGRTVKLFKKSATIALPLSYPVTDWESWLAVKDRYTFSESRFAPGWDSRAREARDRRDLIVAHIPGGFDEPRQLMGEEELCVAYYTQPDLVHDMMQTMAQTAARILERVVAQVPVDVLSVHEDLAGKSGPLVGPNQIREFIAPYYRAAWDVVAACGAQIFQQDSDGNVNPVIEAFMEAGVNCMYPMEPAAGMDMVQVRKTFGRDLRMIGGIDKHVLRQDKNAIRRELEYKLQPMMREGGVVFGLDHRIPNGTPIENYRYYVKTARELLGLEPDPEPGWGRMAF
jgi:hypothetical protein